MNQELSKFGKSVYVYGWIYALVQILGGVPLLYLSLLLSGEYTLYLNMNKVLIVIILPLSFFLIIKQAWTLKNLIPSPKITLFLTSLLIGYILTWVLQILNQIIEINSTQIWWYSPLYSLSNLFSCVAWIFFAVIIRNYQNNIPLIYINETVKGITFIIFANGIFILEYLADVNRIYDIVPIATTFSLVLFLISIYITLFIIGYFRTGRTLMLFSDKYKDETSELSGQIKNTDKNQLKIGPAYDSLSLLIGSMAIYSFFSGPAFLLPWVLAIVFGCTGIILGIRALVSDRSKQIKERNPMIMSSIAIIIGIATLYLCFM